MRNALATLWLLCACTAMYAAQATQIVVVVRAEDKPVAGVEVVVGDKRTRTNANGEATIDVVPGTYEVVVRSPVHLPFTSKVEVAAGTVPKIAADLERLPELE